MLDCVSILSSAVEDFSVLWRPAEAASAQRGVRQEGRRRALAGKCQA